VIAGQSLPVFFFFNQQATNGGLPMASGLEADEIRQ
jgi:hypothetical protein